MERFFRRLEEFGFKNGLFYFNNCSRIFGDAGMVCKGLVNCLRAN